VCRVLGLSPSGYYGWLRRRPSARARRATELKVRILAIWIESGGIYGCPRIHAALLAEGERVSRKPGGAPYEGTGYRGCDAPTLQDGHD